MAFDSFMGSPTDSFDRSPDDGFITISTPTTPNPKMKNFGNTEMADFKKDERHESRQFTWDQEHIQSWLCTYSCCFEPKKAPKKGGLATSIGIVPIL